MLAGFLLLIFTSCQVLLITNETNKYSRTQERFLYNIFIDESDKRDTDYKRQVYLYTVPEIRQHLNSSINNYYSLKTKSLEKVEYPQNMYSVMEVSYLTMEGGAEREYFFKVDNTTLGPFDKPDEEVKKFLNGIIDLRMNYTFKTYVPYYYNNNFECSLWNLVQTYDFTSRAHFIAKLDMDREACADITPTNVTHFNLFVNKLLWIHIIVIALATWSMIMTWNYIKDIASMYVRVKSKHKVKKV
jgi:hypothetical protein